MKKRTTVYSAEEKALIVMLEGEQEEERRREKEKQVKKERDRQLQRKHRMDAVLFGGKTSQPVYTKGTTFVLRLTTFESNVCVIE